MEHIINKTEYTLLTCLGFCLRQSGEADFAPCLTAEEWEQVAALAERHEVLALLENLWEPDKLSEERQMAIQWKTARTVHKGIQLQMLNGRLTTLFEKEGILAVTLKGCAVARYYPVPEFRKTTDLDLFVASDEEAEKAVRILCENGFRPSEEWHANHHDVLVSGKKEEVELHTAWADAF